MCGHHACDVEKYRVDSTREKKVDENHGIRNQLGGDGEKKEACLLPALILRSRVHDGNKQGTKKAVGGYEYANDIDTKNLRWLSVPDYRQRHAARPSEALWRVVRCRALKKTTPATWRGVAGAIYIGNPTSLGDLPRFRNRVGHGAIEPRGQIRGAGFE
jgi:hypothetical protein